MRASNLKRQIVFYNQEAHLKLQIKTFTIILLMFTGGLISRPLFASEGPEKSSLHLFQLLKKGLWAGQTALNFHASQKNRVPQKTAVLAPKPKISRRGRWHETREWKLASRGGFENYPYVDMEATAYDPGPVSCGPYADGYTATGMRAGYGVAAVDPRVIPLGTRLYVPGYGYAVAADVGGAIQGNRIDLCFNTYREAIQFGRRRVRIYLLGR